MTSIAVAAGCQSLGLAQAMAALRPGGDVEAFNVALIDDGAARRDALRRMADKDIVFVMPFDSGDEGWCDRAIVAVARRSAILPLMVFRGFHPDTTYLPPALRRHHAPTGDYHSILCIAGFVMGYTVRDAARLFNALVYARLGYLDSYDRERAELVQSFGEHGIDLAPYLDAWRARGCFMHSINHPKPHVLHDVAAAALRAAGIAPDEAACLDDLPDTLDIHARLPVYPDIAARLGIAGDMRFRPPTPPGMAIEPVGLHAFVAGSFAAYRRARRSDLADAIGVRTAMRVLATGAG